MARVFPITTLFMSYWVLPSGPKTGQNQLLKDLCVAPVQ